MNALAARGPATAPFDAGEIGRLASCLRLLHDTGVSTAPGIVFAMRDGRHCTRFSYAISGDHLDETVDILTPWFARQPRLRAAAYSR